jgi:hypothetical protein
MHRMSSGAQREFNDLSDHGALQQLAWVAERSARCKRWNRGTPKKTSRATLAAHGGLRQRPLVGGAGEAQVPRGGREGFELIQRWRSRWRLRGGVACPTRMQPIQEYRLNGVRCSRSLLSTRCRAPRRVADDECTSCMRSTAGCMPAEPLAARAAA